MCVTVCIVHPLEYSYSDLDEAGSEESLIMEDDATKEPTEAEFEKMLFENLSSEESGHESEEIPKRKKSRWLFNTIVSYTYNKYR